MFRTQLSPGRGRLLIVVAAMLWSSSGAFAKTIDLPGPTMACLRAVFAGVVLLPFLRRDSIRFQSAMIGMVVCFAAMNLCYVSALTSTTAANAIFLQYTAPAWMFLASVIWLGEPVDRRSLIGIGIALVGVTIVVAGGWQRESFGILLGLAAGIAFGGVAVFLRVLREQNPIWLTTLNHLSSGMLLVPVIFVHREWSPVDASTTKLVALAAFGAVQMALPYILFSRGLSVVSAQEAGLIALLEPVLNPLLTWLVVREVPSRSTLAGGAVILVGLCWRYSRRAPRQVESGVAY